MTSWPRVVRAARTASPVRNEISRGLIGHPELLRRAIENVLRNAIRYAPRDTDIDVEALDVHLAGVERGVAVDVGVAAGFEQPVALAQRHVERGREDEQRLPARLGASGFDEADVTCGEPGLHREVDLAHAARGSPVPQQLSHRARARTVGRPVHARHAISPTAAARLPRR